MNNIYKDDEFNHIVSSVLTNQKFKKMTAIHHHGITRMEHSIRVSYISYKVSKILKLNQYETARAGLLHDFFMESFDQGGITNIKTYFKHPQIALNMASQTFDLTEKEKDIIVSHMFPMVPNKLPKYAESWVVNTIDNIVGVYEYCLSFGRTFRVKLKNATVLTVLFLTGVL